MSYLHFQGYYKRVPEYFQIVDRKILGCFPVPMVHSALLIDLHRSVSPSFRYMPSEDYTGPVDDIIIFAHSVRDAGTKDEMKKMLKIVLYKKLKM